MKAHPEGMDQGTPQTADLRRDLAWDFIRLGDQEPGEANALYREALAQFEAFAKDAPRDAERQKDVMFAERKVGPVSYTHLDVYKRQGS